MAGTKKSRNEEAVITQPIDVNSKEYKEFQAFILSRANALSDKQRLSIELNALKFEVEDYVNSNEANLKTVGYFLRRYLERLGIQQNTLANYISMKPSNFSKILSGSRRINYELSFILGQIFHLDPKYWMLIQMKNEYLEMKSRKSMDFKQYRIEDLVDV